MPDDRGSISTPRLDDKLAHHALLLLPSLHSLSDHCAMIIAERHLPASFGQLRLALHAPEQVGSDWRCCYETDSPDNPRRFHAHGIDAMQALLIAMQMMSAELYMSQAFKDGALGKEGFNLPVPMTLRDMAVGVDRE